MQNTSGQILLAGPAMTYVEDQFVGHSEVPHVAAGQHLTIGLGVDGSLRATRSLVSREERQSGGNLVAALTYQLSIENFGDQPTDIRLLDRLPYSEDRGVAIALSDPGKPLSEDDVYRQGDYEQGILRWDITISANAMGMDADTLTYEFTIEHDHEMTIASQ